MARSGKVFAARYHGRILRTPTDVAELGPPIAPSNVDEYSSAHPKEAATVAEARAWLLQRAMETS
jgi:hypothetical protein